MYQGDESEFGVGGWLESNGVGVGVGLWGRSFLGLVAVVENRHGQSYGQTLVQTWLSTASGRGHGHGQSYGQSHEQFM